MQLLLRRRRRLIRKRRLLEPGEGRTRARRPACVRPARPDHAVERAELGAALVRNLGRVARLPVQLSRAARLAQLGIERERALLVLIVIR